MNIAKSDINRPHPVAFRLHQLMIHKKTNLCLSADCTTSSEILRLAKQCGPHICLLKLHADIIDDFSQSFIASIQQIALQHQFLLFEDRKFADIPSTVQKQYTQGPFKIIDWADIVNCHALTGEAVIKALKQVGLPKQRALLMVAEMSCEGHLLNEHYTQQATEMMQKHPDFVIGTISQKQLVNQAGFLTMTPGVHLNATGDGMGQQYRSPTDVILKGNSDIVIVGRDIYDHNDPAHRAQEYQECCWSAYQKKIKN